ncbi:MAG: DUF3450 domain-containing protein [Campylobacteraceae bacterium]|nr:DUF3450 domain-containing protein [Campylobacteraceae bacterium]
MNPFLKVALLMAIIINTALSNTLEPTIKVIEKTNSKLNTLQKKINKSEDKRLDLFNEYKYVNQSLKNTKNYNAQLQKILDSQNKELNSIDEQITDISQTQKQIFPLMKDMIISLKMLLKEDTPFLLTERKNRVTRIEKALEAGDIKTHEKYRIILEAFKIEYDYAKTIESYQENINDITYNILRLGRVALYTQTLDLKEYAYFNKETQIWVAITDSSAKSNIRKAIKIAKKQQNVDLLSLPFLALKDIK